MVGGGFTYVEQVGHEADGLLKTLRFGLKTSDGTLAYTYNARRQLAALTGGIGGSQQQLSYTYDGNGNVSTIFDQKSDGGEQTQTFTYDAPNRLTSAAASGGTSNGQYSEVYRYDSLGRLAYKGGLTYTYGSYAHKNAVTARSDGFTAQYDAAGNQTYRKLSGEEYALAYDAENRLVRASGPSPTQFVYDGDGNLYKTIDTRGSTWHIGK